MVEAARTARNPISFRPAQQAPGAVDDSTPKAPPNLPPAQASNVARDSQLLSSRR
jgi:hypothetical protein